MKFNKKQLRAEAIIEAAVREAYDETEEEASLFAAGLVEKLVNEGLL